MEITRIAMTAKKTPGRIAMMANLVFTEVEFNIDINPLVLVK